tara:strand:- start:425229 stop:425720 length:492 start_codon:yes stop_codon:yes gene_type:complete
MMTHKMTSMCMFAGVLAPGVLMIGVRFVGQGPAQVRAASVEIVVPENMIIPDVELIPDRELIHPEKIKSPFWFEDEDFNTLIDPFEHNLETEDLQQDIMIDVVVSAILPSSKNPLAVINSKPCRVGDVVQDGWKLMKIDGANRTVYLVHKSGKKIVVSMSADQ